MSEGMSHSRWTARTLPCRIGLPNRIALIVHEAYVVIQSRSKSPQLQEFYEVKTGLDAGARYCILQTLTKPVLLGKE